MVDSSCPRPFGLICDPKAMQATGSQGKRDEGNLKNPMTSDNHSHDKSTGGRVADARAKRWDTHRSRFGLCTSALAVEEAERGHQEVAERRLEVLDGIAMLPITEAAVTLTDALIQRRALPANARNDAIHIAVSAVHGVDYLLTGIFPTSPMPKPSPWSVKSVSYMGTQVQRYALRVN